MIVAIDSKVSLTLFNWKLTPSIWVAKDCWKFAKTLILAILLLPNSLTWFCNDVTEDESDCNVDFVSGSGLFPPKILPDTVLSLIPWMELESGDGITALRIADF